MIIPFRTKKNWREGIVQPDNVSTQRVSFQIAALERLMYVRDGAFCFQDKIQNVSCLHAAVW